MNDIAARAAGMTDQQLAELWNRCRFNTAMELGKAQRDIFSPDETDHPKALRRLFTMLAGLEVWT